MKIILQKVEFLAVSKESKHARHVPDKLRGTGRGLETPEWV